MASKKFTQFNTANNTSEPELSVGVKSGDNFKRANHLTATTAPTASNDGTQGYTVGSKWFDTLTKTLYICSASTTGAAVWRQVTAVDGSWTPSISATNDAVVSVASAFYQYAGGNLCHFSMNFQVQLDALFDQTEITIGDLPVSSSFTTSRQAIIAVNPGNTLDYKVLGVQTTGSNLVLGAVANSNGLTLNLSVVGHYLVL